MIRTGAQYLDSIRDGREVYINGGRVMDVTRDPMFKPLIDIRARIYDMQHEAATRSLLAYEEAGGWNAIANKLPRVQQDWWDKRRATDTVLDEIGGAVYRNFDWDGPLAFVKKAADLSDRVLGETAVTAGARQVAPAGSQPAAVTTAVVA